MQNVSPMHDSSSIQPRNRFLVTEGHECSKCCGNCERPYKRMHSRTPLIRTLVIRIGLALRENLSRIQQKLTCLEITGFQIEYSTVLWLLVLPIRRGRKVQTQVRTVNSNSQISNFQCSIFSKKNPIIRISTYPDGWPSHLIRIIGVLQYST